MSPMQRILAERKRQIDVEGWTPEHDDTHSGGELLRAAVLYYSHAKLGPDDPPLPRRADGAPVGWPWHGCWWKPKDRHQDLVRAGALCLAERERLRRIKGSYCSHVEQKLGLILAALGNEAPTERPKRRIGHANSLRKRLSRVPPATS